ncbi:hypothetical protein LJC04_05965 [Ruminococcaceae bacterium OttesenSCG-928-O06]|nr:hypothetical protein [Ruminococcaceae bacterium OttesenSCG-928-O06]
MKKTVSLLLIVLMALCFVACGGEEAKTPYQLYVDANQKMTDAGSFAADAHMLISMSMMGQTMDMEMDTTIKTITRSETDIDMEMLMTMSYAGMTIDTTAYYTDGYMYALAMGQKQKQKMDAADMASQGSYNIDFTESAVKESSVTDVDGGKLLSFVLDGSVMNDLMAQQMAGTGGGDDVDVTIEDVPMEVTIDGDGNLKNLVMDFTMVVTSQGLSIDCTVSMTMDAIQVGGVTIDFPADLDTYPEVTG